MDFPHIIETITEIATFAGAVTLGVLVMIGLFDKVRKQRKGEADSTDDRLITLLKDQVDALERKVENQSVKIKKTEKQIKVLQAENEILRDVLQGKDEAALEAVAKVNQTLDIARQNGININKMNKSIEKLYSAIERHLHKMEQNV